MQTVLITGCSSGFGLESARTFHDRGWSVIAAMRTPRAGLLPASERLRVVALDVTDPASIARVVAEAGPIDALVNNAGIGWLNALEGTPMPMARQIFETNTLGTIAMAQAVVPQFRERGNGVIVNVSSSVTLLDLPLMSIYTASKAAVNAFSDVLAIELAPFGVRVRVVLPGRAPDTSFAANARALINDSFPAPYLDLVGKVLAGMGEATGPITHTPDVVEAIWQAVTDPSAPSHIPAGADAVALSRGSENKVISI